MAIALDPARTLELTADQAAPGKPFAFTGKAGEYFGIWIVNLLLSVVTLGIYSAWAKVRTKRYFYGNTRLDGSTFDYLATPVQILKGRLIAFAFFVAYAASTTIWPMTIPLFVALMFLIAPWAIVRARAFNAHNSSYRNVRFGFTGGLGQAFKLYVLWPIAAFLTVGAVLPYLAYRTDRFLIDNSRYGRLEMTFNGEVGAYFRIYGMAFLIGLPAVVLIVCFWALSIYVSYQTFGLDPAEVERTMAELIAAISPYFFLSLAWLPYAIGGAVLLGIVASSYLTTHRQNYLFDNTMIGPHALRLDLKLTHVLWIRLSNLVVIALSFGLMIPWARIRMTRYQIEQMSLIPQGDLDTLVGEQVAESRAYGDELGEGMDLDIGLGV